MLPQRFLCALRSSPLWCTRSIIPISSDLAIPDYLLQSIDIAWFARRYRQFFGHAIRPADCVAHYLHNTRGMLANPNLAFDEVWYRQQYPDVMQSVDAGESVTAWDHYLHTGAREQRNPTYWFDERWYQKCYPEVYEGVRSKALLCGFEHYLLYGITTDLRPSFYFDTVWYRRQYLGDSENQGSRRFPIVHFVTASEKPSAIPIFDASWYRTTYMTCPSGGISSPADLLLSPYEHYMLHGRHRGHSPCAMFDEAAYRSGYPVVTCAIHKGLYASGIEHYLTEGALSGFTAATHLKTGGVDYSTPQYLREYEESLRLNLKQLGFLQSLLSRTHD